MSISIRSIPVTSPRLSSNPSLFQDENIRGVVMPPLGSQSQIQIQSKNNLKNQNRGFGFSSSSSFSLGPIKPKGLTSSSANSSSYASSALSFSKSNLSGGAPFKSGAPLGSGGGGTGRKALGDITNKGNSSSKQQQQQHPEKQPTLQQKSISTIKPSRSLNSSTSNPLSISSSKSISTSDSSSSVISALPSPPSPPHWPADFTLFGLPSDRLPAEASYSTDVNSSNLSKNQLQKWIEIEKNEMEMRGWMKSLVDSIDLDEGRGGEEDEDEKLEQKTTMKKEQNKEEEETLDLVAMDLVLKSLPSEDFDFEF